MSQPCQYQLVLNDGLDEFEPLLTRLSTDFDKGEATIHQARNTLKVMDCAGEPVVVKSFQVLSPLRRWIYSRLRQSKACRSYWYSKQLISMGAPAPEPIGYIEFMRDGLLYDSYYVSRRVDYDFTAREMITRPEGVHLAAIEAAGQFIAALHDKGILHLDLSPGNLLIKQQDVGFDFFLVDVNRMKFTAIDERQGIKNLIRLMEFSPAAELLVNAYAKARGLNADKTLTLATQYSEAYQRKRLRKEKFKKLLGR